MSELNITGLCKKYPSGVVALDNFNLKVGNGESVAILGLDKSGKSTLLRILAGLESATEGEVTMDKKNITDLLPKDRNMAYAFQNTALDNNGTVYDNLAYGLRKRKTPEPITELKVKTVAEILKLSEHLQRKPKMLTALQRRRVILGRTIARDPGVYLFDEPLAGLAEELKEQVLKDLVKLQIRLNATFIYATENPREAAMIGERIVVLSEGGKTEQIGTPQEILAAPANEYVAVAMGIQ